MNKSRYNQQQEQNAILIWRDRILKTIYIVGMLAGAFIIIPLVIHLHHIKHWPLFIFDCLVAVWGGFALAFWHRLNFFVKAAGALGVLLLTGVFVLWHMGPFSGGGYWLFTFPIGCSLLLGMRPGIAAIIINAVILFAFGVLIHNGRFSWGLGVENIEARWLVMSLSFMLVNLLSVVSISTLNKFLFDYFDKQKEAKLKLELEGRQLQKAVNELTWEKAQHDQAQGELWAEKEIFRALSEEAPLGLGLCSADGRVEYINSAFTEIFGYEKDDVKTVDHWLERAHPDPEERKVAFKVWKNNIAAGRLGSSPIRTYDITCKDGSKKPILFRSVGLVSGKRLVLFEDCSDRVIAAEALRQSEERYRLLVKSAPAGIIELDVAKGLIAGLNDVALEMIDFPLDEIIGSSPLDLFPEEVHGAIREKLDDLTLGLPVDESMELLFTKRSDGQKLCLDVSFSSAGGESGGYVIPVIINDITNRKASEQALVESEKRFRQTADLLPMVIIECTLDLSLTYINRIGIESFGYGEDELFGGLKVTDLVHADYHPEMLERVELMHKGQLVPAFEVAYLRKNGTQFYGLANCAPVRNGNEVVGVRSAVLDVTESKKSLQALRDSEFRYRTLFENINDLYCVHDMDGRLLDVNPAVSKSFGAPPSELINKHISAFMPEELKKSFYKEYIAQIKAVGSSEGVFTVVGFDGQNHYLEYRNVLVEPQDSEPYVVAVGRDITERIVSKRELRRLQIQLQQSQKMEAVGTLAGGVAHDFNNILQAISGYAEVLDRSVEMDHKGKTHLRAISDAVERASNLVQQLLTFSRKVEPELLAVDINAEVRQTVAMLARTIPKMIDIDLCLAKDVKLVRGDANQLGQILLNLGANARDAMPDGGMLKISTSNLIVEEGFFDGNVIIRPGGYVLLSVEDNGLGMNPEQMVHIYDPFFTTKPMGEGTGLGLSMVFGIVKGHKGYITCQSEKDKGTVFKVYLPSQTTSDRIIPRQKSKHETVDDFRGVGTILLVDDEEPILNSLQSVVESHGYNTFTANNGERALEIAAEANGSIDLVVLDLGMPGMGGLVCMRKLHEIMPDLKILIASGYSQHGPFEALLDEGAVGYLKKPFAIDDLMYRIRSVLETTV